jgi:cytochrome c-type biogenesis protein CcmF
VAIFAGSVLYALGVRGFYPQVSLILGIFVTVTIAMEFYRGAGVIAQKSGTNLLSAAVTLTRRNTRRYGGYIVHFGMVLIFIGITGAAFNSDREQEMAIGDQLELGPFQFRLRELRDSDNPNYAAQHAVLDLYKEGRLLGTMEPERRFYKASRQPTTEAAIRPRLSEDLYVIHAGMAEDEQRAVITVHRKPLVNWIWVGGFVLAMGTLLALVPSQPALRAARRPVSPPMANEQGSREREEHEVPA